MNLPIISRVTRATLGCTAIFPWSLCTQSLILRSFGRSSEELPVEYQIKKYWLKYKGAKFWWVLIWNTMLIKESLLLMLLPRHSRHASHNMQPCSTCHGHTARLIHNHFHNEAVSTVVPAASWISLYCTYGRRQTKFYLKLHPRHVNTSVCTQKYHTDSKNGIKKSHGIKNGIKNSTDPSDVGTLSFWWKINFWC